MKLKKTRFSLRARGSIFLLWLEKQYKKNKLNFNVVYFASLTTAFWKTLLVLSSKNDPSFSDLVIRLPALVTVGHFIFYFTYRRYLRKYLISFSGVGTHEVTHSFDQLSRGGITSLENIKGDLVFKTLKFSKHLREMYVYPTDDRTKKLTGEINYITFMDTVWSGKLEWDKEDELKALNRKIKRNKEHLERHPKSVMLISGPQNHWMGFTHILPVNALVWEKYLRGEIADATFPAYNISKPGESAYGLIIFSIGSLLKFAYRDLPRVLTEQLDDEINLAMQKEKQSSNKYNDKPYVRNLSKIYKGMLFHITDLIDIHFKNSLIVPIMVQIEDDCLRKVFEYNNFMKHKGNSSDGYDIYTAHIILERESEALVD
jgi:hypothetical protein